MGWVRGDARNLISESHTISSSTLYDSMCPRALSNSIGKDLSPILIIGFVFPLAKNVYEKAKLKKGTICNICIIRSQRKRDSAKKSCASSPTPWSTARFRQYFQFFLEAT